MSSSPGSLLIDEVERLFASYLNDPIDRDMSRGNAAVAVIEPSGRIHGRIFGSDPARGQWCLGIAQRKLAQVWRTGYATGHFEELVYAGKLDEGKFGVNRPDFIGWEGGVPLEDAQGQLYATAFSGFRGVKDIEIVTRSAAAAGLRVRTNR